MKLLILSHPYNGACNFAAAVAADLGHNYFQLPLDNEVPKKQYLDGNEYDIPKGMAPHVLMELKDIIIPMKSLLTLYV